MKMHATPLLRLGGARLGARAVRAASVALAALAGGGAAVVACTSNTDVTIAGSEGGLDFDAALPAFDGGSPVDATAAGEDVAVEDATADQHVSPLTDGSSGSNGDASKLPPDASGDGNAAEDASDASDVTDASDAAVLDAGLDATVPFPITLESPGAGGAAPNGTTYMVGPSAPSISQTGRYLAFFSGATNLAGGTGATGGSRYFTRDTVAGTTIQVSTLDDGGDLNWPYPGAAAAISGDGRYVVYVVLASAWDPALPANEGVFLRWDRTTGKSTLVGETADGGTVYSGGSPVLSSDGRYLAFFGGTLEPAAAAGGTSQVWVRDFSAPGDGLTLASVTNGPLDAGPDAAGAGVPAGVAGYPTSIDTVSISSDATVVVFDAEATNLQPGAQEAGVNASNRHCYARNLTTHTTVMIDVQMAGAAAAFPDGECDQPVVSGNGRYVVFFSDATNLVAGDTNGTGDVFLRDLQLATTTRLTTTSARAQIATLAVLYPDYGISSDGSIIVLGDRSHLMVAGDQSTDNRVVVVLDQVHQTRKIASFNSDGSWLFSGQDTWTPGVSADGTAIAFMGSGSAFFPTGQTAQEELIEVETSAAR